MAPFRWPNVEHDIALCKEIVARRPAKADEWEDVAMYLSSLFSNISGGTVQLKGRGCRERGELLVKKHKADERKALKR